MTTHAALAGTARVINTLLRAVHGGSSGWGSLPNDDPYPTENKDPNRRRISFTGGDPVFGRVSRDRAHNSTQSRRGRRITKTEECEDKWIWQDETTLVRAHNTPRRRRFVPKEAESPSLQVETISGCSRDIPSVSVKWKNHQRFMEISWEQHRTN